MRKFQGANWPGSYWNFVREGIGVGAKTAHGKRPPATPEVSLGLGFSVTLGFRVRLRIRVSVRVSWPGQPCVHYVVPWL